MGAPAAMSQSGYVAGACAPSLRPFGQGGPSLVADESAPGAVAPALALNGTMAVAVPSQSAGATYYSQVDELSPKGAVLWAVPIPKSGQLTLELVRSTIAILGSGPSGNFLVFAHSSSQTTSTLSLDPQSQYELVATPSAFVLTRWLGRGEGPGPGSLSVYAPSGRLVQSVPFAAADGEDTVQAAASGGDAFVYAVPSGPASTAGYPAALYTVNGATDAVSGPYAFRLGSPGDQLTLLPGGELLFHATGLGTSTAELLRVKSGGVATLWRSTGDFSGAAVYSGSAVLLSGGLFATAGDNPAKDVVGVKGVKTLDLATGAVSRPLVPAGVTAPLWPIAAGPWGTVAMVQATHPTLAVLGAKEAVRARYAVRTGIGGEGWIYALGAQTVALSPLFPGKALVWPASCAGAAQN